MKQLIHPDRSPWIVNGFVIGVSISLFVRLGVVFLLSLIENLEFPESQVLLFTVLFYGVIFFIAYSGVRVNARRNRDLVSRNSFKNLPFETEMNSVAARVKSVLWNIVTIVSVAWLTPALVIYWIAPRHSNAAVGACCFLFSLAGATAYLLKTVKKDQTVCNRLLFFAGVCFGVLAVACFLPVLQQMPARLL